MVDAYGDIFEDYPTMNRRMEEKKKEIVEKEGFRNVKESGKFWKNYIRKDICWQSDLLLRRM